MDQATLHTFSRELQKLAIAKVVLPQTARERLLAAGYGAGALAAVAGGKRLVQDVRMGEQVRKNSGGGYYP